MFADVATYVVGGCCGCGGVLIALLVFVVVAGLVFAVVCVRCC